MTAHIIFVGAGLYVPVLYRRAIVWRRVQQTHDLLARWIGDEMQAQQLGWVAVVKNGQVVAQHIPGEFE